MEDTSDISSFNEYLRRLNKESAPTSNAPAEERDAEKRQALLGWTEILLRESLSPAVRARGFSMLGSFVSSEASSQTLLSASNVLPRLISAHRFLGRWFSVDSGEGTTDATSTEAKDTDALSLSLMQLMRNLALHPHGRRELRQQKDYLEGLQRFILDSDISAAESSSKAAAQEKKPCSVSQCMAMAIVRIIYTPCESAAGEAASDEQVLWDFDRWIPHASLVRMLRMQDGRTLWPNIEAARVLCMWSLCPVYVSSLLRAKAFRPIFVFAANSTHPVLLQEAATAARILLERHTQLEFQMQGSSNPLPGDWATPHIIPALASWIQHGGQKDRVFAMQVLNRGLMHSHPVFGSEESRRDIVPALSGCVAASVPGAQILLQRLEASLRSASTGTTSLQESGNKLENK